MLRALVAFLQSSSKRLNTWQCYFKKKLLCRRQTNPSSNDLIAFHWLLRNTARCCKVLIVGYMPNVSKITQPMPRARAGEFQWKLAAEGESSDIIMPSAWGSLGFIKPQSLPICCLRTSTQASGHFSLGLQGLALHFPWRKRREQSRRQKGKGWGRAAEGKLGSHDLLGNSEKLGGQCFFRAFPEPSQVYMPRKRLS